MQGHSPSRVLREVALKIKLLEASQLQENTTRNNNLEISETVNDCNLQTNSDEVICCWIMKGKLEF